MRIAGRVDVHDLAERDLVEVEEVRSDVEQGSALEPPAACVRAAGQERAGEEAAPATECIDGRRGLGEATQSGMEAIRQHEQRTDTRVRDRVGQALRFAEVGRERLLEEHRLPGLDRAYREDRAAHPA